MMYTKKKYSKIQFIAILLPICLWMFSGCSQKAGVKKSESVLLNQKLITKITTQEDADSVIVFVQGNRSLTFTSVKQPFPPGVILYFPETALDQIDAAITPDTKFIRLIQTSELEADGHTSRIEISLEADLPYDVSREDDGLRIVFQKPFAMPSVEAADAENAEKPAELPAAVHAAQKAPVENYLHSVYATQYDTGLTINVKADGPIDNYKTFAIDHPARIVFDLFDVKSNYEREYLLSVNSPWAKSIRHFGYPDRVRLVIDTKNVYLSEYTAKPIENGMLIHVGNAGMPEAAVKQLTDAEIEATKPAWVNRIDFSSGDAGKSTIIVGTTLPVQYNITKVADRRLQLSLLNTRLPTYRQRPLITTRFDSAVDRIMPIQSDAMKDRTELSIEMREAVPYYVEQVGDLLMVHFEASSVLPKPMDDANLPPWKKVMAETLAADVIVDKKPVASVPDEGVGLQADGLRREPDKKYTGEKIALDFFETDIKNVFRIIREISGENFAIDKDVTGKVSLTFEKPVPWDQVLDIVLKMNQLGKVYEGNIIRIATLKTLKDEEDSKREQYEAEKKAGEQQKALEPLVTKYLAISYSNAQNDVQPHLEKILTKDRGSISVDTRTNQVIITDTEGVIRQAREIVKNIDKVTPQVIIEARIVEASTNFSREIGVEWGGAVGVQSSDVYNVGGVTDSVADQINNQVGTGGSSDPIDMDGSYGWNSAVNLPIASSAGILGFNFIKVAGTPVLLNAKLMAMESQGEGKIISAPKIVTLDNKTASIRQGLRYPFNKLDESGNTTTEYLDITLELETTPQVTPDNRISMRVKITKTDIGSIINNQQSFTTKEAETELLVDDGDTIVIGGIIKTLVTEGETGIPWLSKIPILGWLFKSQTSSDQKEELLIFITPRIVQLEQRGFIS